MNCFIYEIYELDDDCNHISLWAEENNAKDRDRVLRELKKKNPDLNFGVEKLVLF